MFILALILIAILLTNRTYLSITNSSEKYTESLFAVTEVVYRKIPFKNYEVRGYANPKGKKCEASIIKNDEKKGITNRNIYNISTSLNDSGIVLTHRINPLVVSEDYHNRIESDFAVVTINKIHNYMRHNRTVEFRRPKGALIAELKSTLTDYSNTSKSEIEKADVQRLLNITVDFIDNCHGLSKWGDNYWYLRLISGPIQNVIVVMGWFCVLIFVTMFLGLISRIVRTRRSNMMLFAIESAESIADMIPYVGFFGTIVGMSGALWTLGGIDASNATQKAVEIGPISNDISVALETTKLALIFYISLIFILKIVRISTKKTSETFLENKTKTNNQV